MKKYKNWREKLSLTWRSLNDKLYALTEAEVLKLLDDERGGSKRISILERLHQRYSVLRATKERIDILKEARRA
jgi:hypothetical protein